MVEEIDQSPVWALLVCIIIVNCLAVWPLVWCGAEQSPAYDWYWPRCVWDLTITWSPLSSHRREIAVSTRPGTSEMSHTNTDTHHCTNYKAIFWASTTTNSGNSKHTITVTVDHQSRYRIPGESWDHYRQCQSVERFQESDGEIGRPW